VSEPLCKGGNGLGLQANELVGVGVIVDMFGAGNEVVKAFWTPISRPSSDTLSRPDGSKCNLFSSGAGTIYDFLVCPLGLSEEPSSSSISPESSSSSVSNASSSSESVSSDSGNSSGSGPSSGSSDPCSEFPYLPGCNSGGSSGSSNICDEFPDLPGCDVSGGSSGSDGSDGGSAGSGGSSDSEGGSAGSGGGNGNCTDINNCDWAKLDVQLVQLGVETQIRANIKDVVGLLQHGYNVGQNQLGALNGIINAVNGNGRDVVGAISGMGDGLSGKLDGIGSGLDSLNNKLGGLGKGLDSLNGSLNGMGDTAGFGGLLGSFGSGVGGGEMGDSLGDGVGMRNRIKQSIGIDSGSFSFFGNSDNCPVFNFTFDTGFMGIKCVSEKCVLNLCNAYGVNVASILRSFLWLAVILSCLFMNLHTIKTGGRG
jgi:hypothetical protein